MGPTVNSPILSTFGGIRSLGHEHRPQLPQSHEPRHGAQQQPRPKHHHDPGWQPSHPPQPSPHHVSLLYLCPQEMKPPLPLSPIPHHTFAHCNSTHLLGAAWTSRLMFSPRSPRVDRPGPACGSLCPTQSVMAWVWREHASSLEPGAALEHLMAFPSKHGPDSFHFVTHLSFVPAALLTDKLQVRRWSELKELNMKACPLVAIHFAVGSARPPII